MIHLSNQRFAYQPGQKGYKIGCDNCLLSNRRSGPDCGLSPELPVVIIGICECMSIFVHVYLNERLF